MFIFIAFVTALILVATVLPFFRRESWWIRVFDFPRLQFLFVACISLISSFIFLDITSPFVIVLVCVLAICSLVQLWWIVPYTPLFPVEVKSVVTRNHKNRIKILVANVLGPNRNSEGLLSLVEKHTPDVLATLESDHWWQEQLDVLETEYKHAIKCPMDNLYGMHVYSRFPLENGEIKNIVEDNVPSIHCLIKLPSGKHIRAHFLHPSPPGPTQHEESTERDAELITVARSVAETDVPVIVTGDLNDVAWSGTTRLFRKISGLLDPRIGRGMYNSFNAKYPLIRFPLDHLFHSDHFRLVSLRRLPKFGSDHFAIMFELEYVSDRDAGEPNLTPKETDNDLAKEKSDNMDVSKEDVPVPEEILE